MADKNQSTDPFRTWNVGSVESWVANTNSQQFFEPVQVDPHGITQQYLNVNHYHYNIKPADLDQVRYTGSIQKIQIEGMPPGRPKKETEVKQKFTRAPMTYGEYKRMRDDFINGSEAVYTGSASYTQYPVDSVPKAMMIEYQTPESRPLPYLFSFENPPNDRNNEDGAPREPQSSDLDYQSDCNNDRNTNSRPPREPRPGDWNCTKCNSNNFQGRKECFRCHEPLGNDVQSYQGDSNNHRNTSSRPPREPRPGDWNCSKCNANNFQGRKECFRCHYPIGDDVQSYQDDNNIGRNTNSRPPRQRRSGDWNCSKCKANNFQGRTECFRCHEPIGDEVQSYQSDGRNSRNTNNRPRQPRPGDWNCTKCNANNFQGRTDCFRCHKPKGHNFESGSPSRNDGFVNKSWGGGNNSGNGSTTAQDDDDCDDDEPKVVSNPPIEKRKLSSDVYGDDKSNGSPGQVSYGDYKSNYSPEQVPKKRKLSDDWDEDNDEQNETIKLSEDVFNTDGRYDDEMSGAENNKFETPSKNNFEEKQDVEDRFGLQDENNFEEKQDVDKE